MEAPGTDDLTPPQESMQIGNESVVERELIEQSQPQQIVNYVPKEPLFAAHVNQTQHTVQYDSNEPILLPEMSTLNSQQPIQIQTDVSIRKKCHIFYV